MSGEPDPEPDSDNDPTPYYVIGFLAVCFTIGLVLLGLSALFGAT